ncbi:MAG: thioredoxin family protein [Chloroflexi bacterium]|nr:thioredoxin family protein [Chloroflexota bacterium]
MIERLLLVALLFALGYLVYAYSKRRQIRHTTELHILRDPVLAHVKSGTPAIIYFTTPQCVPCQTVQRPALAVVERELGVQVVKIDATLDPAAAQRWGVLSVPTTFILDSAGRTRDVNYGVAPLDKLKRQITALNELSA